MAIPAKTGITKTKIISAAWVEKSPLKTPGSTIWVPGLGELGADQHRDQAADEEEEEGGDDVLDPDHLVIGVELEVVAPDCRAVLGVVLGDRRRAGGPAEPVVEGAEADQEAERAGDRRDDQVRVAGRLGLEDLEAGDRAQGDDQAEAERRADAGSRGPPGSVLVSSMPLPRALPPQAYVPSARGRSAAPPVAPLRPAACSASHASNSSCDSTTTVARIVEWPDAAELGADEAEGALLVRA